MPRLQHRRRPPLTAAAGLAACLLGAGCGGTASSSGGGPLPLVTAPLDTGGGSPGPSASPAATATAGFAGPGAQLTILATLGLNLRATPSTSGAVLGSLGQGSVVTVVSHQTGWYQVKGTTTTGWITDNPDFSSPRHFQSYDSLARGFSLLYPDTWAFVENPNGPLQLRPQNGPQVMTITTAPTVDALGQPGRPGYGATGGDTVEVYGITGVLRTYDRGAGGVPATSEPLGSATATSTSTVTTSTATAEVGHLAEIRLQVRPAYAIRIDFDYASAVDLAVFHDILNSVVLLVATTTPTPGASPSPTP